MTTTAARRSGQISAPIEQAVSGLRGLVEVRSISRFGFSQVTVIFDEDTDIYLGRQVVSERLSAVEMPCGIGRPSLGPVATGLGACSIPSFAAMRRDRWRMFAPPTIGWSFRRSLDSWRGRGQLLGRRRAPDSDCGRSDSDRAKRPRATRCGERCGARWPQRWRRCHVRRWRLFSRARLCAAHVA